MGKIQVNDPIRPRELTTMMRVTDLARSSVGRLQPRDSAQPADHASDMRRTAQPALAAM